MLRDPAIQVSSAGGGLVQRSPYWRTVYNTRGDAVSLPVQCHSSLHSFLSQVTAILQDYDDAIQRANALDASLAKNASDISSHYADLISLTARQAMAGIELTVGGSESNWNLSDVQMFMKDIGSSK